MKPKKKIVVLTGAGISAESGIKTFRDAGGLWEGHTIEEVATPQGWEQNPELVLEFYNQRRKQLLEVQPNNAHYLLQSLEEIFEVQIITQNVDDLHERAGSKNVLHLHGELRKVRSTKNENLIFNWDTDLKLGDNSKNGAQLRPHIVWFGEAVPNLIYIIKEGTPIYFIDPKPNISENQFKNLTVIAESATLGMETLLKVLESNNNLS